MAVEPSIWYEGAACYPTSIQISLFLPLVGNPWELESHVLLPLQELVVLLAMLAWQEIAVPKKDLLKAGCRHAHRR